MGFTFLRGNIIYIPRLFVDFFAEGSKQPWLILRPNYQLLIVNIKNKMIWNILPFSRNKPI